MKNLTLLDVKQQAIAQYDEIFAETDVAYPIYYFASVGIQQVLFIFKGLTEKLSRETWLDGGGVKELILVPYFKLDHICQAIPDEVILLKKTPQKVWIKRDERFLPKNWPIQADSRFSSMAHVVIALVIDIYSEMSKCFNSIKNLSSVIVSPKPSPKLLDCIECLSKVVPQQYYGIDFDTLEKEVVAEIEYELGLFVKSKQSKGKTKHRKRKWTRTMEKDLMKRREKGESYNHIQAMFIEKYEIKITIDALKRRHSDLMNT